VSPGDDDASELGCFDDTHASHPPPRAARAALVLSDRRATRKQLAACLSGAVEVHVSGDVGEALDTLRGTPDVGVVVATAGDLRRDGLDLVARLREVPGYAHVPVLLLTSTDLGDTAGSELPDGVDDLAAPAGPEAVRTRVGLLVDLAAARREAAEGRAGLDAAEREWWESLRGAAIPVALVHAGEDMRICTVNEAFLAALGGSPAEWRGRPLTLRVHREDTEAVEHALDAVGSGREPRHQVAARWVGADMRTLRGQVRVTRLQWPETGRPHLRAQVVLEAPADRPEDTPRPGALDPLTGLPDRALLLRQLRHALGRAHRTGAGAALLVVDLDGFRDFEAAHGRDVADRILVSAAGRLGDVLRPGDIVARLGRDVFALLCEDVASDAVARHIAERVRLAVPGLVLPGGEEPAGLTASVGVVTSDGRDEREQLLWRAQQAVLRAKEAGRDRTATRPEAGDPAADVRRRLREAMDAGRMSLHYQPLVDLNRRSIVGTEALLRLNDPQRGLVMPDEFLPAAEGGEEVTMLAEWTLDEACRQLRAWSEARPGLTMSVNLSARQLNGADVVSVTRGRLERHGLPPQALRLEVDEVDLRDRTGHVHRSVTALAALGVDVAVDRFGTGNASLTALRGMPLGSLKVAASLVHGVATSREGSAVVAALLALGRALGMHTIAVGVETAEQEEALRALGCEIAQGFHLGAPRPASEMRELLSAAT